MLNLDYSLMAVLLTVRASESVDQHGQFREGSFDMNDHTFEVRLRAVVRVRALDGEIADKVVSSALGGPGSVEIRLANENNAACGNPSLVTDVDFFQAGAPKLVRQMSKQIAA
jgi:hypothetical protein